MAHFAHLGENFLIVSSLMRCSLAADRDIAHMRYGDLCRSTHQPSLGSGAPLEGLRSNSVVEDLPLGHLGWSSHQERHHRRHHRREPLPPVGPGRAHFACVLSVVCGALCAILRVSVCPPRTVWTARAVGVWLCAWGAVGKPEGRARGAVRGCAAGSGCAPEGHVSVQGAPVM